MNLATEGGKMDEKRREADKPTTERKEAKETMPVEALKQKTKASERHIGKIISPFAVKKPKEADSLLYDGISQFEKQLIQGCREDGMSDSEIREWLQEI